MKNFISTLPLRRFIYRNEAQKIEFFVKVDNNTLLNESKETNKKGSEVIKKLMEDAKKIPNDPKLSWPDKRILFSNLIREIEHLKNSFKDQFSPDLRAALNEFLQNSREKLSQLQEISDIYQTIERLLIFDSLFDAINDIWHEKLISLLRNLKNIHNLPPDTVLSKWRLILQMTEDTLLKRKEEVKEVEQKLKTISSQRSAFFRKLASFYVPLTYRNIQQVRFLCQKKDNELESLYFYSLDASVLRSYSRNFENQHSIDEDPAIMNRTFEHRLEDHEIFVRDLLQGNSPKMKKFYEQMINDRESVVFIDIGPGIANTDKLTQKGKPAITSQEMAERFPSMPVVLLDLPEYVDLFTGKSKDKTHSISPAKRKQLLDHTNIHIVSGDGLLSFKNQWEDARNNPYPQRSRFTISENTPLIMRAANSIDIYCPWDPDVKSALIQLAIEYKDNPIIYFFNQSILYKAAHSEHWKIIGEVSPMGFNHNNRNLDRNGKPPYTLY